MPEISRFLGIVIGMIFNEHGLPHFHAVYGEYKVTVEIESGTVRGEFPPRALRLVLEWARFTSESCSRTGSARRRQPLERSAGVIMNYDVMEARYIGGYEIWLRFRDNTSGEIDLERELYGPVFEPLRDPTLFNQFEIHPDFHTLTWPNGADFAPEFLHDTVRVTA